MSEKLREAVRQLRALADERSRLLTMEHGHFGGVGDTGDRYSDPLYDAIAEFAEAAEAALDDPSP